MSTTWCGASNLDVNNATIDEVFFVCVSGGVQQRCQLQARFYGQLGRKSERTEIDGQSTGNGKYFQLTPVINAVPGQTISKSVRAVILLRTVNFFLFVPKDINLDSLPIEIKGE